MLENGGGLVSALVLPIISPVQKNIDHTERPELLEYLLQSEYRRPLRSPARSVAYTRTLEHQLLHAERQKQYAQMQALNLW